MQRTQGFIYFNILSLSDSYYGIGADKIIMKYINIIFIVMQRICTFFEASRFFLLLAKLERQDFGEIPSYLWLRFSDKISSVKTKSENFLKL